MCKVELQIKFNYKFYIKNFERYVSKDVNRFELYLV